MVKQASFEMGSGSASVEKGCWSTSTKREKYLTIATIILVLCSIGLLIGVIVLATKPKPTEPKPVEMPCVEKSCLKAALYITDKRDTSYKPCDNFYMNSCANYMKNHIPLSATDPKPMGVLSEMTETTNREVLILLQEKDTNKTIEPVKKVRKFFRSCIDKDKVNATIIHNAVMLAMAVDGIPIVTGTSGKGDNIVNILKFAKVTGYYTWFNILLLPNAYDGNGTMLFLYLKGIPDVNNTLDIAIRVAKQLNHYNDLNEVEVRKFYSELYEITKNTPPFQMSDVGIIKPRNITEVSDLMGDFDIKRLLNGLLNIGGAELKEDTAILFTITESLINMTHLINKTDPGVLMNIVFINFLMKFIPILPGAPVTTYEERAKMCLEICQTFNGHVIGKMYVDKFYNDNIKKQVETVIGYIRKALPKLLEKEEWLDKSSREAAVKKTTYAFNKNLYIGYPPLLYNVTVLTENLKNVNVTDEFLSNYIAFSKRFTELNMKEFIKGPGVESMLLEATVTNAVYNPLYNSISIPLAILQAPVFQVNAPLVLNFGGIGIIAGHELIHAFGTFGLLMDYQGKYKPWLTNNTASKYERMKSDMIDQYSKYKIKSVDKYVNGTLTFDENMADNGGVKLAYMAYKLWRKDNPNVKVELPGVDLSEDQLFFTAFAQVWCSNKYSDVISKILRSEVHAPGEARVQVTMMNSKYFSDAFNCPVNATMNPKKKVSVW